MENWRNAGTVSQDSHLHIESIWIACALAIRFFLEIRRLANALAIQLLVACALAIGFIE